MAKKDVELMKLVQAIEESIQSSDSIHFFNDMEASETKREIFAINQRWEKKDPSAVQYMIFCWSFI